MIYSIYLHYRLRRISAIIMRQHEEDGMREYLRMVVKVKQNFLRFGRENFPNLGKDFFLRFGKENFLKVGRQFFLCSGREFFPIGTRLWRAG